LSEWVNLNSWMAHLFTAGRKQLVSHADWALQFCFEYPSVDSVAFQECRLDVAARYIEHCAPILYRMTHRDWHLLGQQGAFGTGWFPQRKGISRAQWRCWKRGFAAFSKGEFSDSARAQAKRARQMMKEAEEEWVTVVPRLERRVVSTRWLALFWSIAPSHRPWSTYFVAMMSAVWTWARCSLT